MRWTSINYSVCIIQNYSPDSYHSRYSFLRGNKSIDEITSKSMTHIGDELSYLE